MRPTRKYRGKTAVDRVLVAGVADMPGFDNVTGGSVVTALGTIDSATDFSAQVSILNSNIKTLANQVIELKSILSGAE